MHFRRYYTKPNNVKNKRKQTKKYEQGGENEEKEEKESKHDDSDNGSRQLTEESAQVQLFADRSEK